MKEEVARSTAHWNTRRTRLRASEDVKKSLICADKTPWDMATMVYTQASMGINDLGYFGSLVERWDEGFGLECNAAWGSAMAYFLVGTVCGRWSSVRTNGGTTRAASET